MGPEASAVLGSVFGTGAVAALGAAATWRLAVRRPAAAALASPFVVVGALGTGVAIATRSMVIAEDDYRTVIFVLLAGSMIAALVGMALARHVGSVQSQLRVEQAQRAAAEVQEATRRQTLQWLSHDLRTPLTGIRVLAESRAPDALDQIVAQVDRVDSLVDDLSAMASVQQSSARRRVVVDFDDLVSDAVATVLPLANERRLRIDAHCDAAVPIRVDPVLITRAITNVLRNAVEHSPEDAALMLTTSARDDQVALTLCDQGPGVSRDDAEAIFTPGWRGDQSRTRPGTGLGLAIARDAARRDGGEVRLLSHDLGACFELTLPRRLLTNL